MKRFFDPVAIIATSRLHPHVAKSAIVVLVIALIVAAIALIVLAATNAATSTVISVSLAPFVWWIRWIFEISTTI